MLNIQQWFIGGKTAAQLATELGIYTYEHPSLPLVGLKYDQIESPRTHPIVKECRGIILEKGSWKVVGKPFPRFYNAGEDLEEFKKFNWNNFICATKEDGSLAIVYHYQNTWHMNTSGSFGLGEVNFSGQSWRELFWNTFAKVGGLQDKLNPKYTYVFELCTPYNKVIRAYREHKIFGLGVFDPETCTELSNDEENSAFKEIGVERPYQYAFKSIAEINAFLQEKQAVDRTFEGVIIRDDKNLRFKIKTETYLAMHHLKDNGNLFNPKRIVPLLLNEGKEEILAYFPEGAEAFAKVEDDLNKEWTKIEAAWQKNHTIPIQKDFALAIKGLTPFTGILFNLRKKHGDKQTIQHLKEMWRENAEYIAESMYHTPYVKKPHNPE